MISTDECKIFGLYNERFISVYEEMKIEEFELFSKHFAFFINSFKQTTCGLIS